MKITEQEAAPGASPECPNPPMPTWKEVSDHSDRKQIEDAQGKVKEIAPYQGASSVPVTQDAGRILMSRIEPTDIEIRPDGLIYLPEIKYRRVLNTAFGPGGWSLIPRGDLELHGNIMCRTWALYAVGRFISEAVGEQEYFENNPEMSYATAAEGAKSNALMRCCKDLGIASELWDPGFVETWKKTYGVQVWRSKAKKPGPQWRRRDRDPFYDETGLVAGQPEPQKPPVEKKEAPKKESSSPSKPPEKTDSGTFTVTGFASNVEKNEKPTKTGSFKYKVTFEGQPYYTFDEKIIDWIDKNATEVGTLVLEYSPNKKGYGNDIVSIRPLVVKVYKGEDGIPF